MFLSTIWLIPLLPALGAVLMAFIGRRLSNRLVSIICVGLVLLALIWSIGCFAQLLPQPGHVFQKVIYTWIPGAPYQLHWTNTGHTTATFSADAGFLLDPLSAVMILIVTGVGFLIHVYSVGYMAHEGGYYRFFGYLNLFMFSMLVLVLANNYLMLFVGWEGVGLCSYLLIGFWFRKTSAWVAGMKAFIVNRIGDAGFIIGMLTVASAFGTLRFTEVTHYARAGVFPIGAGVMTAATLLMFWGATGKSAQLPLYVWLPDAMEGPTPVSALIHAATMVTAGVYMVCRSNALFTLAPDTMKVVAIIGCVTALFAASIALVQTDIKKVLAYSTISQLGYMFLACGVGAFAAGIFHVMTHAFFKALLFLGAGSVIHALSGEQDMRQMGALKSKIPKTYWTMFVATLAIAGIPPLAGFVSKDLILGETWAWPPDAYKLLWIIGLATAGMTAFYMFRLLYLTFFGDSRVPHDVEHHIHESPNVMTTPLIILAVLSVVGGWIGWPKALLGGDWFTTWLRPVFARAGTEIAVAGAPAQAAEAATAEHTQRLLEYGLMAASVIIALIGISIAYRWYVRNRDIPRRLAERLALPYRLLLNKYYVDEGYDKVFVSGLAKGGGTVLWRFDATVIDGGVNGAGWLTRIVSRISMWLDKWIIDGVGVNGVAYTTRALSWPARLLQTGLVQSYALLIVFGLGAFVLYYLVR